MGSTPWKYTQEYKDEAVRRFNTPPVTSNSGANDPSPAGRSGWPAVPPPERPVLAIVVAMSIVEQMPLADVKNRLSEVVDSVEREHGRVVITRHGRPAAIVISVDDLESLEETLAVMGSTQLIADVREALDDLDEVGATVLTKDEALRLATGR